MTLASAFMAAAPAEWKRSVARPLAPDITLTGLFASRQGMVAIDYIQAPDISHVLEVDGAEAQAFGLVVRDVLLVDGVRYAVDDLIASDLGTLIAVLRQAPA